VHVDFRGRGLPFGVAAARPRLLVLPVLPAAVRVVDTTLAVIVVPTAHVQRHLADSLVRRNVQRFVLEKYGIQSFPFLIH